MRRILAIGLLALFSRLSYAQDSIYTRKVITYLTSEKCFGRGYLNNGQQVARKFILDQITQAGLSPVFGKNFTQTFYQSVNTFPGKMLVKLNGKQLTPGVDFIPDPGSPGLKGK